MYIPTYNFILFVIFYSTAMRHNFMKLVVLWQFLQSIAWHDSTDFAFKYKTKLQSDTGDISCLQRMPHVKPKDNNIQMQLQFWLLLACEVEEGGRSVGQCKIISNNYDKVWSGVLLHCVLAKDDTRQMRHINRVSWNSFL